MEDFTGIFIVIFLIILAIHYVIAKKFSEIVYMKGCYDSSYFWYCFLLGIVGYLMVVALPDKNARYKTALNTKTDGFAKVVEQWTKKTQ